MHIAAHIVVNGADAAATFYTHAFGAEEIERIPTPDGRLMSVQLRIGESVLHVSDEFPEWGVVAPSTLGGSPVVLALDVCDADAAFARAVEAGATARQPVADMFWGERHGQLADPFGHRWNISQFVRDVPHDEVVAAAAQLFS
jgi:PhnB protein